jgi:hypothetical protein
MRHLMCQKVVDAVQKFENDALDFKDGNSGRLREMVFGDNDGPRGNWEDVKRADPEWYNQQKEEKLRTVRNAYQAAMLELNKLTTVLVSGTELSEQFRDVSKGSRSCCPRKTAWNEKFFGIPRSRIPRNATSDFKASGDITNTKKVRRLAAVLLPLSSSVLHPISAFPRQSLENSGK